MIIIVILVIIALVYFLFKSEVFADDTFVGGTPNVRIDHNEDIDNDGNDEKISLLTYEIDGENLYILEIKNNFLSKRKLVLKNFEIDIRFCNEPIIDAGDEGRFVCLVGYVGVHSERAEIIEYKNNQFKKIYFVKDEFKSDNLISDAPNLFVDSQGNEDVQICADNRDYENDPLLDFFRTCYILSDNNEFEFASKSNETIQPEAQATGFIQ